MNNTYLIYGNNYGLIKREIDKITNGVLDVVKYDLSEEKVDTILDEASCISLFGDKKVIIAENCLFLTASPSNVNHDIEYLEHYIEDENHDNIVIFTVCAEKLDERKKIVKKIKNYCEVIHKEQYDQKDLPKFVILELKNDGYEMDYKTANYFIEFVGNDIDIILSEIEKLKLYKMEDKKIVVDDINKISSKALNDNVFDLCDAIMKKDFKRAYNCYSDLINLKEEPIKIIALIGNQFSLVYQVKLLSQNGKNSKDIASALEVHPYRVKLALETNYMIYELKDIIRKLHELDFEIKTGKIDKNIALESFLLHL